MSGRARLRASTQSVKCLNTSHSSTIICLAFRKRESDPAISPLQCPWSLSKRGIYLTQFELAYFRIYPPNIFKKTRENLLRNPWCPGRQGESLHHSAKGLNGSGQRLAAGRPAPRRIARRKSLCSASKTEYWHCRRA